jgi:hypothetical protein
MDMPLITYHGTRGHEPFERFDHQRLGVYCDNPTTGFGFYLTSHVDDAVYWAERRANRYDCLRVLKVEIAPANLLDLVPDEFQYYLQRARASTINKQRGKWMGQGFEGFRVQRERCLWHCMFTGEKLRILQNNVIREGSAIPPPSVRRATLSDFEP